MKTMMRTATAAAAMALLLSACGGSPTGSATQAGPAGPSYDGGFTMGSGNREQPQDTVPQPDGTTTSAAEGYGMGSGS
jgi:ABC-type glycerol-3-phosphate transport system substrate-binding protein